MTNFSTLGVNEKCLRALQENEITDANEVQQAAIPPALTGQDVLVTAPTGSGKTFAYLLPLISHFIANANKNSDTRALILAPTRELALQIQKNFEMVARYTYIKSGLVIGGEPFKHQIAALRRNPEILIGTPGRIVEHIEKGSVSLSDLEILVLDEADRMLDMGFTEQMDTVFSTMTHTHQTLLFSATLAHKGFARIKQKLVDPVSINIGDNDFQHENIQQQVVLADNDHHKEQLTGALILNGDAEKIFVFCKTRAQSQKVSNLMRSRKITAAYIHSEVTQSERKQILNRFRDGKIRVLVATDVVARGIDVKDVSLVINFTAPHSPEDYVHRIGRTGRAGAKGRAVTLIDHAEWNAKARIEKDLSVKLEQIKIDGLVAAYTGPKKIKASGKAASTKKKSKDAKPTKKLSKGKASSKSKRSAKSQTSSAPALTGFEVWKPKK